MPQTIAIQGAQASFHDQAAAKLFGADSQRRYCENFAQTFAALRDGTVDYALVAIENSLHGSINEVYDLLLQHHAVIVGEVYLRIEQCLLGLPGVQLATIQKVYSHPVALAQCEQFLNTKLAKAEREEYHDTAAAAEYVHNQANPALAAIASRQAALPHHLEVLVPSIETHHQNYTRFVALGRRGTPPLASPNKTSLVLELNDAPGALYHVLGVFAERSINLTKLQSRPVIGKAWHYMFYVDVELGDDSAQFGQVLDELANLHTKVMQLGSYQAAEPVDS